MRGGPMPPQLKYQNAASHATQLFDAAEIVERDSKSARTVGSRLDRLAEIEVAIDEQTAADTQRVSAV